MDKCLEKGMIVIVYADPISCTEIEGKAKLVEDQDNTNELTSYWTVHFVDYPDEGEVYRWINLQKH